MVDRKKTGNTSLGLFDDHSDDGADAQDDLKNLRNASSSRSKAKKGFRPIGSLLNKYTLSDKGGFITKEFQDYGYRLAVTLKDLKHKSLYIKMAKTVDRGILERALSFVSDATSAKSKPRLFMWKVKELKKEKSDKQGKNEKD